jgi:hypothetical protein
VRSLVVLGFLAGCYGEFRPGTSTPLAGGHGGTGIDLDLGFGGEVQTPAIRAGGGLYLGARIADTNGFPFGLEGRVIVPISGPLNRSAAHVLGVVHGALAFAHPFDSVDNQRTGTLFHTFVGVGIGHTAPDRGLRVQPGHLAFGVTSSRATTDMGEHYWTVGGAVEVSFGIE